MTDQKIVEFPLSETRLTVRTLNCLASENIITFTQLSKKSYSSLMRVSGLGAKSIAEIVELVNSYGVRIDGQERYDKKRQGIPWVKKLKIGRAHV